MVTGLNDADHAVGNIGVAILESALRKHCLIFLCPFHKLSDHFEQCDSDFKMKIDLFLSDSRYSIFHELGHQASDHDLFGKEKTAENVDMCDDHLNFADHARKFCFSV